MGMHETVAETREAIEWLSSPAGHTWQTKRNRQQDPDRGSVYDRANRFRSTDRYREGCGFYSIKSLDHSSGIQFGYYPHYRPEYPTCPPGGETSLDPPANLRFEQESRRANSWRRNTTCPETTEPTASGTQRDRRARVMQAVEPQVIVDVEALAGWEVTLPS